jgi:hypothetical protein
MSPQLVWVAIGIVVVAAITGVWDRQRARVARAAVGSRRQRHHRRSPCRVDALSIVLRSAVVCLRSGRSYVPCGRRWRSRGII